MTIQMFLGLLFAFASVSDLITEAVKMAIGDRVKYSSNVVVLIVSIVVGIIGMCIYYVLNDMAIGNKEIIYMLLMSLSTWLTGMHGYDKFRQLIAQIQEVQK